MGGYIKLFRKMLDWEWYSDLNTRALFLHCLLKANWSHVAWQGEEINRGEFITSLPKLAEETGLTVQQTRTSLSKLKATGEITDRSTSKFRVITVKNYDMYQCDQQAEQQASNRQSNRQATGKLTGRATGTVTGSFAEELAENEHFTTENSTGTATGNQQAEQQAEQHQYKNIKNKEIKNIKNNRDIGTRFKPPTLDEIKQFVSERKLSVDPETFFFHYEGNGWMIGKAKMKSWQMTIQKWDRGNKQNKPQAPPGRPANFNQRPNNYDDLQKQLVAAQRGAHG